MDFGRKKPSVLFKSIHDQANPLNWFERMKARQHEKPVLLNANVGQIHRTIETREQAMVNKSGSGNQREVGRLAAMSDRDYYRTHSGVLHLSRSNPELIRKIRQAGVPDNEMVSGLDAGVEAAVEGSASAGGGAESVEGGEGGEGSVEGGGGGGGGASSATPLVVPETFKELTAQLSSIPEPTGGTWAEDKSSLEVKELVVKYGPIPNAPLGLMAAVALGDEPSNGFIAKKTRGYIEGVLKIEIGSRKFFEVIKYEATGETNLTTEEFERGRAEFLKQHPSYKPVKTLASSKKELDERLGKSREKDLAVLIRDNATHQVVEKSLAPFRSGDKHIVRLGINDLMQEMAGAVAKVAEVKPELKITWPSSIEVRKTSNNEKIGRLFIDGVDINDYVELNREDPEMQEKISKVGAVFQLIQQHLKSTKPRSLLNLSVAATEKEIDAAIVRMMDDEFPLLRGIFDSLEKQITESLKPFRPKGKGGRPAGSKNKKSLLVSSALSEGGSASSGLPPPTGGAGEGEA